MEAPPGFLVKRGVRGKPSGDLDRTGSIASNQVTVQPSESRCPNSVEVQDQVAVWRTTGLQSVLHQGKCMWWLLPACGHWHFSSLVADVLVG